MEKRITCWAAVLALLVNICSVAKDVPARPVIIPTPPKVQASAHILADYDSQHILSADNLQATVAPASLTKMMTMYVIDNELRNAKLNLEDEVLISEKAWKIEGSRMFVKVDTKVKVDKLIKGIIIQSGNDASIAMAEHIAGSEENFVELMNYYAKILGMHNTNFVNSTGLPHPEHYSTVEDLYILTRALIRDFPETYTLYSQKFYNYNGINQPNRNKLLWRDSAVDGVKTGYASSAGYCISASAKKNGMRLIAVVVGTESDDARSNQTYKLLSYGFRFFETHKLFNSDKALATNRVWMGSTPSVDLGVTDDIIVTIPQGQYNELNANIEMNTKLIAPIGENEQLGTLFIKLGDTTIAQYPVVALNEVEPGNIFSRIYDYIAIKFYN